MTPEFDFNSAFAEAEAAALATEPEAAPPVEDTVVEAAPSERPRDEHGRFVAAETPTDTVDTVQETTETPATPEEAAATERLLAGKYRTVEDLERAYAEAQKMIPEYADWRKLNGEVEYLREQLQQQAAPAAAPIQITADLIERDPASAAVLAYEQDNGHAFRIAFEAWREEDPFSAATWASQKSAEQNMQEVEQKYEQRFRELEQRVAPAAAAVAQQQSSAQLAKVAEEFPEIPALFESGRLAEIAQQFPGTIGAALISEDPAVKAEALRAAAGFERGRQRDTLQANVQDVARAQAEEERRAAEDAYVASSTTATAAESVKLTAEQEVAAQLAAQIQRRSSFYDSGWDRPGN